MIPLRARLAVVGAAGVVDVLFYGMFNRAPTGEPTLTPHCFVDDVVPFLPWTIYPYLTLLALAFGLPPLVRERAAFADMMRAFVVAIGTNYVVWILWPTFMPRPADPGDVTGVGPWRWFTGFDQENNAFPSGHITIPVVAAWGVARCYPRWRWPLVVLLLLLAPSVMSTKQHTFGDLVAGLATALWGIAAVTGFRFLRR
ncbi:MAG: phosphatase PAP2 family protein [Deltaproteobacteria bacterium]|nr:phosphatase PAP2 family protein [Deltaproteobacteria bacterium]